jgi:hypothetical protein
MPKKKTQKAKVGSFSQDILSFIEKTGLRADQVIRKLGFDAYLGILFRSPVRTGRYRASHRISINEVDLTVEPEDVEVDVISTNTVPTGLAGNAAAALEKAEIGDAIYITNNLPYAQALEDGHSSQAKGPTAVYGNTFEQLVTGFAKTVRSVTG